MNFSFIIDTSISMSQAFDQGYSYFDAAKNAIEVFIKNRELIKNKNKPDKYFLITTGISNYNEIILNDSLLSVNSQFNPNTSNQFSPSNIISSWVDTTEHLLFNLKVLQIEYSLTDLENSIQTSLILLNSLKKIGNDKFVYGRLISKINNSFIILLTDGGKLNNAKKVLSKLGKIGLNVNNMNINLFGKNTNQIFNSNSNIEKSSILYSDLYTDSFKWDTNIFTFLLNSNHSEEAFQFLKKYSNIIGGEVEILENFDDLISKIELYTTQKLVYNRVNINLEMNNNLTNENKNKNSENIPITKFINKNNLTINKSLISLIVDFKQFKLNQISNSELIFDRNENLNYREKWPLPDDFILNKNITNLIKKKPRPNYIISNEIKNDFPNFITRNDFDEYEIIINKIDKNNFMIKLLENYPDLNLGIYKKNLNKIYWEVFNVFSDIGNIVSEIKKEKNMKNINKDKDNIPIKPFGIIRLVVDSKKIINKNIFNSDINDNIAISEFLKNEIENINNNNIFKLKFCVLPYNYLEFFTIINNFNNNKISESEFIIQIEKYMKKIPFYYKTHIVQYLEKKNLWKVEESFYRNLDEENLNENILNLIKNINLEDREKILELNMNYNYNKQMHLSKSARCCSNLIFKNKKLLQNFNNNESVNKLDSFLDFSSNLNKSFKNLKIENVYLNKNLNNYYKDELPIESMGDYRELLTFKQNLRNPHLFENEIKEFIGDYFGNPFKKYTLDSEIGEESKEKIKSNLNNPNISINDGESLLINSSINNEVHLHVNKNRIIEDDELSVYPKIKNNNNNFIEDENEKLIQNNLSIDVNSNTNLILQHQIIEDDLTLEFKQLFKQKDSERHGTKIDHKIEIDINILYDWKFRENIKECNLLFNLFYDLDSRKILNIIKLNQKKEIIALLEEVLSKPLLFYSDLQKIAFLKKIKNLSESYVTNKNVTSIMLTKYINDKMNNLRINIK